MDLFTLDLAYQVYSVKYEDFYVNQKGKWLIKDRVAHFLIIESKTIS
ncbi:hypothetical protein [Epilithonimonas sp.]|nr:hypothetical protein [Epilithonimonas sp.]